MTPSTSLAYAASLTKTRTPTPTMHFLLSSTSRQQQRLSGVGARLFSTTAASSFSSSSSSSFSAKGDSSRSSSSSGGQDQEDREKGDQSPTASSSSTTPSPQLTHTDPETGRASMVSVTDKAITSRTARATARMWLPMVAFELLKHNKHKKGDVLTVAQIAGIQAAKQTSTLIPLCHPLLLSHIAVDLTLKEGGEEEQEGKEEMVVGGAGGTAAGGLGQGGWVLIESRVACKGNTGVEMEALTAASTAALTVFDMCKAVGKDMVITEIKVEEKTGGKSGHYRHGQQGVDRRGHGI